MGKKGVLATNSMVVFKFASGRAAAGLFVLWRLAPPASGTSDGSSDDAAPTGGDFALGFCGFDGRLHAVTVANPWPLAIQTEPGLGAKLGAEPQGWGADPHQVVFVAHPSPLQAKQLLERLNKKSGPDGTDLTVNDWPIVDVTPKPAGANFVVEVPETPESFVPKGHADFGGWTLYRRMPYADVSDVRKQVQKLAFVLGQLRFPTDYGKRDGSFPAPPYPKDETSHSGVFDAVLQSCLRRFQLTEQARIAFRLSPEGNARKGPGPGEKEMWAYTLGGTVSLEPRALVPTTVDPELGVVDSDVATELFKWQTEGLRNVSTVMVSHQRNRLLFAQPRLWLVYLAIEKTAAALGMAYAFNSANSSVLPISRTTGPGVEFTFHKLGRAIDLENAFDEVSSGLPLAFEADWASSSKLVFKLYVHSMLDPFANASLDLSAPLQTARAELRAEYVRLMGDTLPLAASSMLVEVERFHEQLRVMAATPATSGSGSELAAQFFRQNVQRFLYRSGADDYGTPQPAVDARADASANNVARRDQVRTWLNLTRIAFNLGMDRISAHEKQFGPETDKAGPTGASIKISPGAGPESTKAILLDRLAGAIRRGMSAGVNEITVVSAGTTLRIPARDFDLNVIENWVQRFSDTPGTLSRTPKGVKFVAAGVDLEFQVRFEPGPDKDKLDAFLDERASVPVRVIKIGDGIRFGDQKLEVGDDHALGDVKQTLASADAIPGKKDHLVVIRPRFAAALLDADPGLASYEVLKMHDASHLEWWHWQLPPETDGTHNWLDFASELGLDGLSYRAPPTPKPTDAPSPSAPLPWVGGGYEGKGTPRVPFNETRNTDPKNLPGRGTRPS